MVELSDPKGPVQEGIDNTIFIIPGIIVVSLISKYICHIVPVYHLDLDLDSRSRQLGLFRLTVYGRSNGNNHKRGLPCVGEKTFL